MNYFARYLRYVSIVTLSLGVVACSDSTESENASNVQAHSPGKIKLEIYKSRTCGCCVNWVEHAEAVGFEIAVHHPADLNQVKVEHSISPRHQSCHTAVSKDGYVFEGHIPARHIRQFFVSPPENAVGLAVPGMPVGSPGMEMGHEFSPYQVLLLKADGSSEVFAEVKTAQAQY